MCEGHVDDAKAILKLINDTCNALEKQKTTGEPKKIRDDALSQLKQAQNKTKQWINTAVSKTSRTTMEINTGALEDRIRGIETTLADIKASLPVTSTHTPESARRQTWAQTTAKPSMTILKR